METGLTSVLGAEQVQAMWRHHGGRPGMAELRGPWQDQALSHPSAASGGQCGFV